MQESVGRRTRFLQKTLSCGKKIPASPTNPHKVFNAGLTMLAADWSNNRSSSPPIPAVYKESDRMTQALIGIIGGSGLYQMDAMQNAREQHMDTPLAHRLMRW